MILSEFRHQFAQLTCQQPLDPTGILPAEIERIRTILQQPIGSVQEAFEAIREIHAKLSSANPCQSLVQNIQPLIREEIARLICSAQNELQELLQQGICTNFLAEVLTFFTQFSEPILHDLLKQLLACYLYLKSQGCDNKTSNRILRQAHVRFPYKDFLEKILQMPPETIQTLRKFKDDNSFNFLWKGGSPYLLKKLKAFNINEFQDEFLPLQNKKEIDAFLERFLALISCSRELIKDLLSSKEKLEFVLRVIDPAISNLSIHDQQIQLKRAIITYNIIYNVPMQGSVLKEMHLYLFASKLTPTEAISQLIKLPKDLFSTHYVAEALDRFDTVIDTLPLHQVATEPLIRFLFSKSFQEAKTWLEEKLPDGTPRLQSISEEQKKRILTSFPCFESKLPLEHWRNLLGFTKQQAKDIAEEANKEIALSNPFSTLNDIDSNDPLSALVETMKRFEANLPQAVVLMLLCAKESSACGGRSYLTWGNADPGSALCAASDSTPLYTSQQSIYQTGAFNDFTFPVPAVTLRRKIIQCANKTSGWLDSLLTSLDNGISRLSPDQAIFFEILRITNHLEESYPGLCMDHETDRVYNHYINLLPLDQEQPMEVDTLPLDLPEDVEMTSAPPSYDMESDLPKIKEIASPQFSEQILRELEERFLTSFSFKEDICFLSLLKNLFRTIVQTSPFDTLVDRENYAHIHGILFMAFFLLARYTQLKSEAGVLDVALSPFVRFPLKYLDPPPLVRREDNPWFTKKQITDLKTDYPFHSTSPITKNYAFTPQKFQSFVEGIQSLEFQEFYTLCAACVSKKLLSLTLDESCLPVDEYLKIIETGVTTDVSEKALTETAKYVLIGLVKTHVTAMPKKPIPLYPGKKIPFNRDGIGDYTPLEKSPNLIKYFELAGNYGGGMRRFWDPVDPRLHDGNCGIISFLLGHLGVELNDEEKFPLPTLRIMMQKFRNDIVPYVINNEAELKEKFGDEEVETVKLRFKNMDNPLWASSLVWESAANIYSQPIVVYGCPDNPGDTFLIGDKGEIEPSAVFQPKAPTRLPPVHLMKWSVHYCFLKRK